MILLCENQNNKNQKYCRLYTKLRVNEHSNCENSELIRIRHNAGLIYREIGVVNLKAKKTEMARLTKKQN